MLRSALQPVTDGPVEAWLKAPTLSEIALRLEGLRRANPVNGDASNGMLDRCLATLSVMAAEIGEDPQALVDATAAERKRLKQVREEEYMHTVGNPEWQAEMRAKRERVLRVDDV